MKNYKYNDKADEFLNNLYSSVGATTDTHKMNILRIKLGGEYYFHATGSEVNDAVRTACLEYEILERNGLIDMQLM